MKNLDAYPLSELKLVYFILHSQILEHPNLMDSDLLHDLQRFLQAQATQNNVDVSDHGQWDSWLNDEI